MNYVTEEGMQKILDEIKYLKLTKRLEATERLNAARKHGDLKENGDYKAAREEISQIDAKLGNLQITLANTQIISLDDINTDNVQVMNIVKVKNITKDRNVTYTIVSPPEADPLEYKLSSESPIGKGMLGKKVGDKFEVEVPAGKLEFEILNISK